MVTKVEGFCSWKFLKILLKLLHMSLVNYSDSSSSDAECEENKIMFKTKRIKLDGPGLPLPKAISDMKITKCEIPTNNPEEHEGRIRSFDHERGNWATFVFIPVNLNIIEEIQAQFIESFKAEVKLQLSKDIHISLSKTVVLRHHWINSFIKSIQKNLEIESEFIVGFTKVSIYCNEERSRTFIGLSVDPIYSTKLERIMKSLNNILEGFKLEKFYKEASFHASILWCVGDHQQMFKEYSPKLQKILDNLYEQEREELEMKVKEISCKTGNKLFIFDLSKNIA